MISCNSDSLSNNQRPIWSCDQHFSRTKTKDGMAYTTRYDGGYVLGTGSSGTVVSLIPNGEQRHRKIKAYKYSQSSMKHEYEISLSWPNKSTGLLLHPKAYFPNFEGGQGSAMVMHKYDGNLDDFCYSLNEEQNLEAVCQISQGLVTLHDLNILHRDLFLPNIFYDKNRNRYDIGDFGRSEFCGVDSETSYEKDASSLVQTINKIFFGKNYWPELFRGAEVDVLQNQGYSSDLAEKIVNFLANPPKNAKAISAFFNEIKLARSQG